MQKFFAFVLLGAFFSSAPAHSDPDPQKILGQKLEGYLKAYKWPGIVAFYSQLSPNPEKDFTVKSAVGSSVPEQVGPPLTSEAVFPLGSCTKAFTVVLLARLFENPDLKLSFDSTLGEVVEKINGIATRNYLPLILSEDLKAVRLESLITHTAGLPDDYYKKMDYSSLAVEDFLLSGKGSNNTPYKYSTFAYSVLAYLTERFTLKRWDQQLQEYIFAPLEMESCFVQPLENYAQTLGYSEKLKRVPDGQYKDKVESFEKSEHLEAANLVGGSGVLCSLPDWNKFLSHLIRGYHGEIAPKSLPISQREIFQKIFEQKKPHFYTFGAWQPLDANSFYHFGANGGYTVVARLGLKNREVMLLASNHSGRGKSFEHLQYMGMESSAAMRALVPQTVAPVPEMQEKKATFVAPPKPKEVPAPTPPLLQPFSLE